MTRSQLSPSLHTQELKEFPQKHFSDFFWMACIQWADGVLTVGDSLFVWSHSLQRILESSSNCLTWYLPSWHVSKDRVPPHLWTFWMVFFLQSVQEVLSDAIVQPAKTSGSIDYPRSRPNLSQCHVWHTVSYKLYCDKIYVQLQENSSALTMFSYVFLATTTCPCRASMTKEAWFSQTARANTSRIQHSLYQICCTVEVPHGCYQQSTITMLPNRCSLSHFCQQPFSGQTLHKWKLGKDNHQTPGCFSQLSYTENGQNQWLWTIVVVYISLLYTAGFTLRYLY